MKFQVNPNIFKNPNLTASQRRLDRQPRYHTVQNDINILNAEICRLANMPYASILNKHKILYLEELLSAYERDLKQKFD